MSLRVLTLIASLGSALVPAAAAATTETCKFVGTTSNAGHVAVKTEVTAAGDVVTVDVTLTFAITTWLSEVHYLTQEISTWRNGKLQTLAVNNRTVLDGRIRRQQWDVMERQSAGLQAYRLQAKTLADFEHRYPSFARHWELASFGQPWLQDYAAASPDRRPDLDLSSTALPSALKPPLALAFYWSRWLAPAGGVMPVFLPGFKQDARVDLAVSAATPGDGWHRWQALLRHPALAGDAPSTLTAWVSADGYLLQVAFDVHARVGSGHAVLRTQDCQGIQVVPTDEER